jgi:hypothetical protein
MLNLTLKLGLERKLRTTSLENSLKPSNSIMPLMEVVLETEALHQKNSMSTTTMLVLQLTMTNTLS